MTSSTSMHISGFADQTPEARAQDLASMPLFAGLTPADLLAIAKRAEPMPFVPEMTIVRQGETGDASSYLYIVGTGTLVQSGMAADGIPWIDRVLQRGDVFGRYTLLFGIPPETTVTAKDYGYLYRISAPDVSIILARWPQLRDRLIPEARIRRLRALPLFSALPDDHLRRLADHVQEKTLEPGELLTRAPTELPRVWVIAEGQVILAPADGAPPPYFEVAPPLSLELATVGFVWVDGPISSVHLTPRQARAVSRTVLYGLSEEIWTALLERFESPDVGRTLLAYTRFPDVPALLRRVREFRELPETWLPHMRGFVGWIHTPRSQVVVQQGDKGDGLYLLERGEAVLRAEDERGRRRPRSFLVPGQAFGRSALLHGTRHDATLEATQPSCWLYLSRKDLDRFNHYTMPDEPELQRQRWRCLWHDLVEPVRAWLQGRKPHLCPNTWRSVWTWLGGMGPQEEQALQAQMTWREPDETVLWLDRQHPWVFIQRFIPIAFFFSASLVAALWSLPLGDRYLTGLFLALTALTAGAAVYILVDYLNDFYAVTDRRVVHHERVVLFFEAWEEIPLERVQDVIQQRTFWDRVWGTGTIIVQSAATQGNIVIPFIPNPGAIQALIMQLRARQMAKHQAWRRERLRQDLQQRLHVQLMADWPKVVTGSNYPVRIRDPKARARWLAARHRQPSRWQALRPVFRKARWVITAFTAPLRWLFGRLRRLIVRGRPVGQHPGMHVPWRPITHWHAEGWLYWRKHPFNLLTRIAQPLMVLALTAIAWYLVRQYVIASATSWQWGVHLFFLVWGIAGLGWLIWRYDDWRNDLYILTPDRIIDIEMKPLFLAEERREAPLNRVQSVRMDRRGIVQNILNYGNVIIQTAAAEGDLTFEQVVNPARVVRAINRYLEEYRRREEEKEYERQQAMIAESLEVYDEIIRGRLPRSGRRWRREDL